MISDNQRVSGKFDDYLSYTAYIMKHIGGQIQNNNKFKDYHFINQLLASYRTPNNEVLSWSTFSWVNSSFHLIVSSNEGINLKNFGDLSKRDYIPKTAFHPGTMQCGIPVYGIKSNLWSIPIGYGVENEKGEYLGAIVTGIVIDGLKKKLAETIRSEKVFFALIDTENLKIITKSDGLSDSLIFNVLGRIEPSQSELLSYQDRFFYKKLPNYHYSVITFHSSEGIYSRWFAYYFMICVVIFLVGFPLFLFERKLIKPIKKLAKIAEDISLDKKTHFINTLGIHEIDNLTKQLKNIQQYKADLVKAKNSQSNFFLNMSHELKTPLTSIISCAELMTKEARGTLQKEYLTIAGQINNSGKHLLTLIDNLLNFSKMKHGKMELQKEDFAIVDEMQGVVDKLSAEAAKKNLKIKIDRQCAEEVMRADPIMFQSAIISLLSNAIKFSHSDGEIKISIRVNDNNELEITVLDHGIGIKNHDINMILDEYGQAQDDHRNRVYRGAGLGLPMVQNIVALHGGKFEIKSIYGRETRAIITLPEWKAKSSAVL